MAERPEDSETRLIEFTDTLNYRIVRLVGSGGMGRVYEANVFGAEGYSKPVALKVLREDFSRDEDFVERFIREAKLAAGLVHVHCVQIYHLGDMGGTLYISMELVRGLDLARFLAHHEKKGLFIPVDIAVYIASRVARALEYAHTRKDSTGTPLGIVHRDVSPTNILISNEGVVKLADFGIAKVRERGDDESRYLLGKIKYNSPEQARGDRTDARSDIFSLGVVLYQMLTNKTPFRGDTTEEVIGALMSEEPPLAPSAFREGIPGEVEDLTMRALRKHPMERFLDTGSFAQALEEAIYRDRFGPTFVTLKHYLEEYFPDIRFEAISEAEPTLISPA